jgi:hypothetical protein
MDGGVCPFPAGFPTGTWAERRNAIKMKGKRNSIFFIQFKCLALNCKNSLRFRGERGK